MFLGFLEKFGFGVPVGGSGRLTDALIACIEDHGGAVLANAEVREVGDERPRHRRRARRTASGFDANDGVIGAIHPHVLPEMVAGGVADGRRRTRLRTHITAPAASPSTPRSTRR